MREMKDSGIAWIGEIPKNWKIKKIKNIICNDKDGLKIGPFGSALANKTIADGAYNIYGQANLVNDDFSYTKNTINKNTFHILKSYQVLPNDICLSMMGTIGKCKTVPIGIKAGIMDSHLIKIRLDKTQIISKFFEYVYDKDLSNICITEMQYVKKGSIMDGLNTSIVKNLRIVVPPVLDQQAIVDFLDAKCADIDSLASDIQKQIEILKEYKKSVITQAVTKGIDPNVEMKDSGVAWIGKIPMTWHIVRLKYLTTDIFDIDHYMPKDSNEEDSIPYLMIGDLRENLSSVKFSKCKKISKRDYLSLSKKNKSQIGDVVFARYATIGTVCYIDLNKNFLVSYACLTIKPKKHILGKYLYYYLKSNDFYNEAMGIINANTQGNIGKESLRNVGIVLPNLQLQEKIINFLDSKCADIDAAIASKQKQLDVLKEYKKSLIYEYVTGKKEVPCRE